MLAGCAPSPSSNSSEDSAQFYTVDIYGGSLIGAAVASTAPQNTARDKSAGVVAFKGVRYAAAPVAEKRFLPPQALKPSPHAQPATQFGPACPQPTATEDFVWSQGDFATHEDCLFLNLWVPASALTNPAANENAAPLPQAGATDEALGTSAQGRAVMVWFHGGAHTGGRGHAAIFDGTRLAERDVIVVTVNYRLGPLGFLAHPALSRESSHSSSGNYGLLDKIAALNWIRDNIAQFGGDPLNITLFGQSAGSQSVCSLMASPLARGLFHKAIGQSAACTSPRPLIDANGQARGQALVDALEPSLKGTHADHSLIARALREATPSQLLAAADASQWAERSRITVDGWVLPEAPADIFAANAQAQIPILVGSLANEGHQLFPLNEQLSEAELLDFLRGSYGEGYVQPLLAAYAEALAISPGVAQWSIYTDEAMTLGMRRWAHLQSRGGNPTYLYFFDHTPPVFRLYMPRNPELSLDAGPRSAGAYHSGDLAYVFNNTHTVGVHWQAADHQLADLVASYWSNFAKRGDPNGEGLPVWPRYNPTTHSTMRLNSNASATAGVRREAVDLLDAAIPIGQ